MAEKAIFTGKEVSFLKELHKQGVDYMIVGAAAAALQGAPIVTQDIDLWFRDLADPGLRKAVAKVGGVIVPSIGLHPPTFAGGAVELIRYRADDARAGHVSTKKQKHSILIDLGGSAGQDPGIGPDHQEQGDRRPAQGYLDAPGPQGCPSHHQEKEDREGPVARRRLTDL